MRFTRLDWLELGLKLLADAGPVALTVDALTAAAAKTRGSFYHHFTDRDAFLAAMMAHWHSQAFSERAAQVPIDGDAAALRAFLRAERAFADRRLECAIRQLAVAEPVVRAALDLLDRTRIAGLALLIARIRPDSADPYSDACVQYAALVGMQWLVSDPDDPRLPGARQAAWRLFGIAEQ